jgi:hypothetical protein
MRGPGNCSEITNPGENHDPERFLPARTDPDLATALALLIDPG